MASVLITGTSKGIGLATALVLGRAGHTVYATMRDPDRFPELAQTAERERLPIKVFAMDVDSDVSVRVSVRSIQDHGPIDVLVNNAGIERRGSIEELDIASFRAVMETNYFGALRCIQAVLPEMRTRNSGCIINVSSVAGRVATSPFTPYSATKFALEALSEGLAQEAKMWNIRVAIVEPGIIDTPMARNAVNEPAPSLYPQGRRISCLFAAALQHQPTPPEVVGQKILEIIDSGTWQLRHPVGSDAQGYLQWRASMTDEEWVERGAADDDTWYNNVQATFGIDARPKVLRKQQS
jgi:NAD(P)-dependent dehydrogenase (short-subunit alcohol dehydrogenase family)